MLLPLKLEGKCLLRAEPHRLGALWEGPLAQPVAFIFAHSLHVLRGCWWPALYGARVAHPSCPWTFLQWWQRTELPRVSAGGGGEEQGPRRVLVFLGVLPAVCVRCAWLPMALSAWPYRSESPLHVS